MAAQYAAMPHEELHQWHANLQQSLSESSDAHHKAKDYLKQVSHCEAPRGVWAERGGAGWGVWRPSYLNLGLCNDHSATVVHVAAACYELANRLLLMYGRTMDCLSPNPPLSRPGRIPSHPPCPHPLIPTPPPPPHTHPTPTPSQPPHPLTTTQPHPLTPTLPPSPHTHPAPAPSHPPC